MCLDGQGVVGVRMYSSLAGIWSGFQKNFFPAFRRESSFWGFLLLHATMFLAPFVMLIWIRAWPMWPILLAAACALAHTVEGDIAQFSAAEVLPLLNETIDLRVKR